LGHECDAVLLLWQLLFEFICSCF